ncbi:MAG: hypothetical protein QF473_36050, partial [Planctomycetota bacterium]|nr:hypothetical protein [Planctomycetota bacterium]
MNPRPAVTFRSILVGAALCILINLGEPYLVGYVRASPLAADFSTGAAIFLLFVLALNINLALKWCCSRLAFARSELLVCYIMMIVACAVPSWGFTMLLIPWIAAPTYYATRENEWRETVIPNLPEDYFVLDEEIARPFFEGIQLGPEAGWQEWMNGIPWEVWQGPLLRWGLFIFAFYIGCICLMVLFRRQWVQHERLSYPLAQLPLAVLGSEDESVVPTYRRAAFWIGVAVPAFVYSLKALHSYFPDVPMIELHRRIYLPEFRIQLRISFFFEVVGLAFLLSSDVLLSIWVFALVAILEQGIFQSTGWSIGPAQPYSSPGRQEISNQALGAMLVLVLVGLWRGRHHLRGTIASALGAGNPEGDKDEIITYRAAWLGLLIASGYVFFWWYRTGLGASALVLSFWMGILFVGLTRVVAQGGMAYARSPVVPAVASLHTLGTAELGTSGVVGLAMTAPYAMDTRTTVMASTANALRLVEEIPSHRRRIALALVLALVVSLIAAFFIVLFLPYRHGCLNLGGWGFHRAYHHYIYRWAKNQMIVEVPFGSWQFFFMGIGALIMLCLMWIPT